MYGKAEARGNSREKKDVEVSLCAATRSSDVDCVQIFQAGVRPKAVDLGALGKGSRFENQRLIGRIKTVVIDVAR